MSSGDVTSWEWEFEGGYPSNSVEQNPQIFICRLLVYMM